MRPQTWEGIRLSMLALLLILGCNVQWVSPVITDPSPPGPVVTKPEFRLLIVEETAHRTTLSADQLSIFTSSKLRQYLDSHCATLADGSHGYRIVDKDDVDNLPDDFRATVQQHRWESTPWLYCTNGIKGLSGPLSGSVDELLSKIKPYAE